MQGSNSPLVPKSEPYYVPPEHAHIIAGDVAMPHQGPAHLIGQGRTAPAAAGRPSLRAPGREGPTPMEVDPFRAPFQIQPLVCPAMLMYWPILSFLIGRLTREQEQAFRALMNTGDDTQQSLGLPGHQAGSVDRAAPTPGNPGQGNATGPVPTPGNPGQGNATGPAPPPGKPGTGKAAPRTRGPVPPPGEPGEGKPEIRERRERRHRQQARRARENSQVLAGDSRRGRRPQTGASPAHGHGPPGCDVFDYVSSRTPSLEGTGNKERLLVLNCTKSSCARL